MVACPTDGWAMTPLERAARALYRLHDAPPQDLLDRLKASGDDEGLAEELAEEDQVWPNYVADARAVLEAIREPDPHTQAIAWGFGLCEGGDPLGRSKELAAYQFLIDAALKEG